MIIADWIFLGVIVLTVILGLACGFSGSLKFFTGGIFGVIISVVVTYFLFGIVYEPIAGTGIFDGLNNAMNVDADVAKIIDQAILAVVMFILVQIVRIIIVKILAGVFEINNAVFRVINRILGIAVIAAVVVIVGLIVFQIIAWIGGGVGQNFSNWLEGSVFKLNWIYENNPLIAIFKGISGS